MARTPGRSKGVSSPPTALLPPQGAPPPLVIDAKPAANPGAEIQRARAIAAGLAPRSVQRLAELVECSDGKVALVACEAVRKWTVEEPGGGNVSSPARPPTWGDPPTAWKAYHEHRDAMHARALALREGLRSLMPDAPEEQFWESLAARLHEAGLELVDAFTLEELDSVATAGLWGKDAPEGRGGIPFNSLPLPLRDEAFRKRIEREAAAALMEGLGPKPGDTLV